MLFDAPNPKFPPKFSECFKANFALPFSAFEAENHTPANGESQLFIFKQKEADNGDDRYKIH
jgi:hypothetical protein